MELEEEYNTELEEEYNRKIEEMQYFIPFLEALMERMENRRNNDRQQAAKMNVGNIIKVLRHQGRYVEWRLVQNCKIKF